MEMRPHVQALELVLEATDVAGHLGPDVGVQADGREALVLAVLGQNFRGDGKEGLGKLLAHDLGDAPLVLRVHEGEQEADGDGVDSSLAELAHLPTGLLLVQGNEHRAVLDDALRHRQPVSAAHDRIALPGQVLVVGEVERLLVPRDVQDVPVALGREHPHPGAVVLDDDVGGDRRAVEDLV
jgi:hypothetical protein